MHPDVDIAVLRTVNNHPAIIGRQVKPENSPVRLADCAQVLPLAVQPDKALPASRLIGVGQGPVIRDAWPHAILGNRKRFPCWRERLQREGQSPEVGLHSIDNVSC